MNKKFLIVFPLMFCLSSCCNFSNADYKIIYRYEYGNIGSFLLAVNSIKVLDVKAFNNENNEETEFCYSIGDANYSTEEKPNSCIDVTRNGNLLYVKGIKEGIEKLYIFVENHKNYLIGFEFQVYEK